MKIKCIPVGMLSTNCYLVEEKGFSAVLDPGEDPSLIQRAIEQTFESAPTHIILTHGHFDHVGALGSLHKAYPSAIIATCEKTKLSTENIRQQARAFMSFYFSNTCFASENFEVPQPNLLLKDGDVIGPFKVLYTPGHTMDSICLYSEKAGVLFSGDTLFRGSYGRTDLGGSFEDIKLSLERLLKELPRDTVVYPGHYESTVLEEEDSLLFNVY